VLLLLLLLLELLLLEEIDPLRLVDTMTRFFELSLTTFSLFLATVSTYLCFEERERRKRKREQKGGRERKAEKGRIYV